MKELITIFTPTYNRGRTLPALYHSLCQQTDKGEFNWLIVDDGSEDNTRSLVEGWIKDNKISIRYYYQENSGKHVAFNRGVRKCDTELFFCVDSDDYLTDDAVRLISETWKNISSDIRIAGIVAYRGYSTDRIIGNKFDCSINPDTLSDIYKRGKKGDTALVFRTQILRQYPFPVFKDEKFMRETIIYSRIDEKYKLYILSRIIYIGKYLEDGLSRNAYLYDEQSPNGAALFRLLKYNESDTFRERFGYGIAYLYYMYIAGHKKIARHNLSGIYRVICPLFLYVEIIRRKIRLKKHVV